VLIFTSFPRGTRFAVGFALVVWVTHGAVIWCRDWLNQVSSRFLSEVFSRDFVQRALASGK